MGDDHHGPDGLAVFFIIVVVIIIVAVAAWIITTQLRARRLGLPAPSLNPFHRSSYNNSRANYPSPAPGGVIGWFNDKIRGFRSRRFNSSDGYEEPIIGGGGRGGRGSRRGFGPLDPDEAWDARVGTEADAYGPYYEEQELGLHGSGNQYGGGGYGGSTPGMAPTPSTAPPDYGDDRDGDSGRGRSRSREGYFGTTATEHDGAHEDTQNPFGDGAERSGMGLRSVSPRPVESSNPTGPGHTATASKGSLASHEESPTERRSMFRENM
ncbi:MAG: hypothetical protein M1819_001659 [Sarea resinae]|nr:MAG: hypothetical protein M1819_001659 [Sarea resinae]